MLGSVFIKKSNQTEFLKKKNRNWVKPTGFGSVRFGFLGQKLVQTGLARFFRFWLGFFRFGSFFWFGSVFPVWLGFFFWFFVGFCSVRFFVYKTEPAGFFKNLIGFFFRFGFFDYFFSGFLSLIDFPVFFSPLT